MGRKHLIFAVLAWLPTTGLAQDELVGLWTTNNCGDPSSLEFQGYTLAAFGDGETGVILESSEISETEIDDWFLVRASSDDSSAFIATVEGEQFIQAWPNQDFAAETPQDLHLALTDGSIHPSTTPEAFDMVELRRCSDILAPAKILLGEPFEVLQGFDKAAWTCRENTGACARTMFDVADITGDGELTVAELARIFRSSIALGTAMDSNSSSQQVASFSAAGFLIAPIAGSAVLHSFDYDGSDSVSFDELLGERLPEELTGGKFEFGSIAEAIADINQMARGAAMLAGSAMR
ncbi:hypothetical protein BVC71_09450 [Marivivens niveibacter]|uniref:EF-hand domain-containing protein n=1 Tax=Marivivens niveibacter TaxID=1930667 RepID=A0A251WYB2_9RHOB|nr:EF-hand domain-containing protein [Marivivens niveibacter]OUD08933.1 hypothetical protein BVC71_09450 [Marivivens niveibacter]